MLSEAKAILVLLRIKKEKKFCNPCALFKETFFFCCFKTFNNRATRICSACVAHVVTPLCVRRAVVPGELCNALSGRAERDACCRGEGGEGLGVLAPRRSSGCGVRKDCCRLGTQMVALGLLGQSWCLCQELWAKRFSGAPGGVQAPDGMETLSEKYIDNFCFDRCLQRSFLHSGVAGSKQHWVPLPPGMPA